LLRNVPEDFVVLVDSSEQINEQIILKLILKKGGCGLDSSGSG
jgi:hypothetical protein